MTIEELHAICRAHALAVSVAGFVRERDAATLLSVAPSTLRRWRYAGEGPTAQHIGRAWRYRLDVLAAFMSANEQRRAAEVSTLARPVRHARPQLPCSRRSANA